MPPDVKARGVDGVGTAADWRTSITREVEAFGRAHRGSVDAVRVADAWRGLYRPSMNEVRNGGSAGRSSAIGSWGRRRPSRGGDVMAMGATGAAAAAALAAAAGWSGVERDRV